jgi:replication factor A2
MHFLEATYVHLWVTRGPPSAQSNTNNAATGGMFVDQGNGMNGMGNGTSNAANLSMLTPLARKVHAHLLSANNTEGYHVQLIASQLGIPTNDIFKAGDELLGAGKIYTTVDDETWAILET